MSGVEALATQFEEKATLANGIAAASPQEGREDDAKGQQEEQVRSCHRRLPIVCCSASTRPAPQVLQVVTPWTVSSEGAIDYAKLINEVRLSQSWWACTAELASSGCMTSP